MVETRRLMRCTRATKKLGKRTSTAGCVIRARSAHRQVLALVGSRNYGSSQVNHAVSHRPTGSIFKPFVYASAFQTAWKARCCRSRRALSRRSPCWTTRGHLRKGTPYEYTPHNFQGGATGVITARYALMHRTTWRHQAGHHGGSRSRGRAGTRSGVKSAQGTPSPRPSAPTTPRRSIWPGLHHLYQHASTSILDAGQRAPRHRRHHR